METLVVRAAFTLRWDNTGVRPYPGTYGGLALAVAVLSALVGDGGRTTVVVPGSGEIPIAVEITLIDSRIRED